MSMSCWFARFGLFVAFFFAVATSPAWAGLSCASLATSQLEALNRFNRQNVSYFYDSGGNDPRKTYDEWARELALKTEKSVSVDKIYEKHAATGRLMCPPDFPTTANLVIKNNVIVTAAHAFYGEDGKPRFDKPPRICKFYVMKKSGDQDPEEIYEVDLSTLREGSKNPYKTKTELDWAVVKLKRPVNGVEPYQVDPNAGNPRDDYKGLAVSAGQKDRKPRNGIDHPIKRPNLSGKGEPYLDSPNLIHRCHRSGTFGKSLWVTNCSAGKRGSGSALLVDPENPDSQSPLLISAISLTGPDDLPDPKNPKDVLPTGYRYNPGIGISSGYRAITGEFHEALMDAAK